MGKLMDHLKSPQGSDPWGNDPPQGEAPNETHDPKAKKRSGSGAMGLGLVLGPGRPRWLGYGLALGAFIVGVILAFNIIEVGDDFGAIIGVVAMFGAAYGALEIYRGKPIWKR